MDYRFSIKPLVALSVFTGFVYKFYSIRVPDGFETPLMFRVVQIYLKLVAWLSKKFDTFGILSQPIAFKKLFKLLDLKPKRDLNDDIQVKDYQVDGVVFRVYSPKSYSLKSLPCIIFYHGGAFIFGSIDGYDALTHEFAKILNFIVISVEYRLAPENKYPIPINDCWTVTEHIYKNYQEFNIDISKLVLAGDSAGGAIASVLTQRLRNRDPCTPKLQILIYPWMQHLNFKLPAYVYNGLNPRFTTTGTTGVQLITWYLGETNKNLEFENEIKNSKHLLLIEDRNLREKYFNYVNINLIPEEYKIRQKYYNEILQLKPELIDSQLDDNSILKRDQKYANLARSLLNIDVSPGLIDDESIKRLPKTLFIICELDSLKDEGLIFSERLRRNGVPVKLCYYENGYHGMIVAIKRIFSNKISKKMVYDITDFIKENID